MQDPVIIVTFGIVFAVIGFLLYYYRDYLPIGQKKRKTDTDALIEEILDKIRQLSRQHDYNQASLNVWRAFQVAADGYLNMVREPNQTARQFALSLLEYEGITQETVEPIYTLFEQARYGRDPVTIQQFNAGLTGLHRFLQISKQISFAMAEGVPEEEEFVEEMEEEEEEELIA